jgi:hypothetical protein
MNKKGSIAAAVLLVAATGGGFAAYKYLNPGASEAGMLADVIPANAYMAVYISNDSAAWEKLQKFGTPTAQKLVKEQLAKFEREVLKESKIDYAEDLQPWVGNVMIAAVPPAEKGSKDPDLLMAIGVKDKLKALAFSDKLKALEKTPTKEIDYKGTKIIVTSSKKEDTYTAVLDDKLLVTNRKATIESAIDTSQGAASLNDQYRDEWFKPGALELERPVAAFYIPNYGGLVSQALGPHTAMNPAMLEQLQKIKSFGGGIAIDNAGIRMKMVTKTDGSIPQLPETSGKTIDRFPAQTLALAGGSGLNTIWQEVNKVWATDAQMKEVLAQSRQSFTQVTKLDLDRDVFGWMGGEYAIAVLPADKGTTTPAGIGGALMIESTDRAATDKTMAVVFDLATSYGLRASSRQLGGQSFTDFKAPNTPGTLFSYGWIDNHLTLTIGGGTAEALATPTTNNLPKSNNFIASFNSLPSQKQSYFYLDVETMANIMNQRFTAMSSSSKSQIMTPEVDAFIGSIRGIGMASVQTDKATNKTEALLVLKPNQ